MESGLCDRRVKGKGTHCWSSINVVVLCYISVPSCPSDMNLHGAFLIPNCVNCFIRFLVDELRNLFKYSLSNNSQTKHKSYSVIVLNKSAVISGVCATLSFHVSFLFSSFLFFSFYLFHVSFYFSIFISSPSLPLSNHRQLPSFLPNISLFLFFHHLFFFLLLLISSHCLFLSVFSLPSPSLLIH